MGKRGKAQEAEKILDVDAAMQGSLVFKDPVNLRINGRFEGMLNTKGNLMIGEHSTVNADITGESIIIAGKVNGSVSATKELKLIAPACVVGDIMTPLLSIAEGAVFEGRSSMIAKPKQEEPHRMTMMTAEELAKYLEVDTGVVAEWASSGKLPATKEGATWRFDRSRIDEWVADGKIK